MVAGRRHTNGRHAGGGRGARGRLRDGALPKGGGRPPRPPGNGQVEAAQHCLAEGIAGREREARPASRGWRERRVAALGGGALSPLRERSRRPLISPHRDAHHISQERHTCLHHVSVQKETPAAPASAETGASGDSAKTGQKPGASRTGVNTPSTAFETIGSHVLDADSWCRLERERAPWGHKKRDGSSETGPAARRMPTWRFLSLEAGPFWCTFTEQSPVSSPLRRQHGCWLPQARPGCGRFCHRRPLAPGRPGGCDLWSPAPSGRWAGTGAPNALFLSVLHQDPSDRGWDGDRSSISAKLV